MTEICTCPNARHCLLNLGCQHTFELYFHHEFSRAGGELVAFALPLLHYFDAAQLRDLIASFEADGCWVYDPHTYVLEDGGMKQVDEAQLAFKRRADPHGLMNPGKVFD